MLLPDVVKYENFITSSVHSPREQAATRGSVDRIREIVHFERKQRETHDMAKEGCWVSFLAGTKWDDCEYGILIEPMEEQADYDMLSLAPTPPPVKRQTNAFKVPRYESSAQVEDQAAQMHDDAPPHQMRPTLTRTSSYKFKRAFFRDYIAKHCQDPSHLRTVTEGSCPFVQGTRG